MSDGEGTVSSGPPSDAIRVENIRKRGGTVEYVVFDNEGHGFTKKANEIRAYKAILDFLYEHCSRPHWQVRFRWQPDSVAFWDNRCVQHIAMWDYFPDVRSGYRVTVKGDKPFHRAH